MFYKLNDNIIFRKYNKFGLITDNSEYGYRLLNDQQNIIGEKYLSESGAVMLNTIRRIPRNIDDIVKELLNIFEGISFKDLKVDVMEFFDLLVDYGYLSKGSSVEECNSIKLVNFEHLNCENNFEDFSIDGIDKKYLLKSIHIDVATVCNEKCIHCYIPHNCKTKTIDTNLFLKILKEARDMNVIHVSLSGGEPLLYKDINYVLEKCKELDFSVNVLSNLTLLTDETIAIMKDNKLLSVQTSIYSMNNKVHDWITKKEGSLEKTITGLLKLHKEGIPVQISCPIMHQNKDCFIDIIRWARSYNISVAVEPLIFASYDNLRENIKNRLTEEELDLVLDQYLSEGYAEMMYEKAQDQMKLTPESPICSVGQDSLCISVDGEIFPCAGWQSNILGNIKSNSLKDIWEHSEKLNALRSIKRSQFLQCVSCKDREYCTVCMMRNYNEDINKNIFKINRLQCKMTKMMHNKVETILKGIPAIKS